MWSFGVEGARLVECFASSSDVPRERVPNEESLYTAFKQDAAEKTINLGLSRNRKGPSTS